VRGHRRGRAAWSAVGLLAVGGLVWGPLACPVRKRSRNSRAREGVRHAPRVHGLGFFGSVHECRRRWMCQQHCHRLPTLILHATHKSKGVIEREGNLSVAMSLRDAL
jgi:hypothetical protein